METSELIKSFGAKLGIDLEPNDDGIYSFEADNLSVSILDLPELDCTALVGDLGEPPPEGLEALYKVMMEANHLFRDTHGATLSLNPENSHFEICKALPNKLLDTDSFFLEIERFVNILEVWSKIVLNYRGAPTEESLPSLGTNGFIQA